MSHRHMVKYIYKYIYILYVYVSNQIQQNKMQPEHVSESERFNIPLCVCALRSGKRSANVPLTLIGQMSPVTLDLFIFSVYSEIIE